MFDEDTRIDLGDDMTTDLEHCEMGKYPRIP